MDELTPRFQAMFSDSFYKMVISKCRDKAGDTKKIEVVPFGGGFQFTRYRGTQVFHQNAATAEEAVGLCVGCMGEFLQVNAWDRDYEYALTIGKSGGVSFSRRMNKAQPSSVKIGHDREKNRVIEEGAALQPLIDMGVFTVAGQVVKSKYDKFRQINRFLEIIGDVVKTSGGPLSIVDFGCGKSYLTFIVYHYFTHIRNIEVSIVGLDLKEDVIAQCNESARKYGYDGLRFEVGSIEGYRPQGPVDMVISLHACDTATDYALFSAVAWKAKYIFAVPCCQHELNAQMRSEALSLLTRYGAVREKAAALLTDAIRANLLEHCGYKAQLLEFVDFEHTPKNIMIRAVHTGRGSAHGDSRALREVRAVTEEFHLRPTLAELLREAGMAE